MSNKYEYKPINRFKNVLEEILKKEKMVEKSVEKSEKVKEFEKVEEKLFSMSKMCLQLHKISQN
jgi:hypothetical protein